MDNLKSITHKIIVLVPFRNAKNYIVDCLNSIVGQFYSNYEVYLLDDASDDDTLSILDIDSDKFQIIRNENRVGATENIYNALVKIPIEADDIILRVDGDDYLLGPYVFQIVNEIYNQGSYMITYGQEIIVDGRLTPTYRCAYTKEEFDNLRNIEWKMPPLRTFKYKLFTELLKQDPAVDCLKFNNSNDFYILSSDVALMYPLMEIAGFENIKMINNILYCYRYHSNNDHATEEGRKEQFDTELEIRSGQSFRRVF